MNPNDISSLDTSASNTQNANSQNTVFSVESLNRQIRQMIEGELGLVWVQGEISNFKAHTSGHFYFSLKDSKSQVSAVMFRGYNSRLRFKPVDGLEVLVRGKVSVYEPRGSYQIVCETMEPVGAGALQKAFEQLKEKLKTEGLFDSARKRPLPPFPKHVAMVTSPTGAAIKDMLNVLNRRNKSVQITLVPTIVQGDEAPAQIVEAMKKAFLLPDLDVIILGRGGGSMEDLWAFNNEALARIIAASPVPVISAVGHEIDFTISDFVADLRAPTPSAAAELVAKNTVEVEQRLRSQTKMLETAINKILKFEIQKVRALSSRLIDPKRKLQDLIFRNDELLSRLIQASNQFFSRRRMELHLAREKMIDPQQVVERKKAKLNLLEVRLQNNTQRFLERHKSQLKQYMSILESLSPLKVVERGYSMTSKNGELVKSTNQLKVKDIVQVQLMQGKFSAQVTEIE